ncbi:MAG: divalent cation tolerance protein CutA [Saprospiraceae bacterium]|nr:divalent cation tolerance protein CutA [Saprospiraceae bacterium]
MISLRISSRKVEKLELIAQILLKEELAIDVLLVRSVEKIQLEQGKLIRENIHLLTAKTKAMLFPDIDKKLRKEFGDEMPDIFSLPIVQMDWDKRDQLAKDVRNV